MQKQKCAVTGAGHNTILSPRGVRTRGINRSAAGSDHISLIKKSPSLILSPLMVKQNVSALLRLDFISTSCYGVLTEPQDVCLQLLNATFILKVLEKSVIMVINASI